MSEPASATPGIDPQNPWPGLLSFPEEAERFFNGRDTERDDLVRLIRRDTLTLLYGQSGLGKSSLLLAGLFPVLRREHMLPVHVRLDHDENSPPHDQRVRSLILAACADPKARVTPPESPPTEGTWELLHRGDGFWDAKNYPVTPVVVIDQFEEIFTLGAENPRRQKRSRDFLEQLGDLIDNNPPDGLLERLAADPAAASEFVFAQPAYKIVLSLREDYLADLRQLREHTRSTMQNETRLLRMRGDRALQAVEATGGALVEPGAASVIVRGVARASGEADDLGAQSTANDAGTAELADLEVEPALLSMICSELNERRRVAGLPTITADLLKRTRNEILADFYERGFVGLNSGMRVFVEERLLNDSGKHRNFAALEDALGYTRPGYDAVTQADVNKLVERRLIRVEERLNTKRLEITHDVLTEVVRISRDRRRAAEKRREEQLLHARQRRRRLLGAAAALVLLVGTAVGAVVWNGISAQKAIAQRQAALEQEQKFLQAEREATAARLKSAQDARLAVIARQQADSLAGEVALKEKAVEDREARLERSKEALKVQEAATATARAEAIESGLASRVGAEAAGYYRQMTGQMLERRTATIASLDSLSTSLAAKDQILAQATAARSEVVERARRLEDAYCAAVRIDSTLLARTAKDLPDVCRTPRPQSASQQRSQ